MPSLTFFLPLPSVTQPAPVLSGVVGATATQYERIYDRLRALVDEARFPQVNSASGNTGGVSIGPAWIRPSSIRLNDTTATFGTPVYENYTLCVSRGVLNWTWELLLDFPVWVSTEHLDRLFNTEGYIFVPYDPINGLEALKLLVSGRQTTHPKPHEADLGTTVSYTVNAQPAG